MTTFTNKPPPLWPGNAAKGGIAANLVNAFSLKFAGLIILLLSGSALSLVSYSSFDLTLADGWNALSQFNSSNINHQIILTLRVPRTIVAMLAGAGLAVAGVLMQGITRNSLASPSLFGIGYGAALAFTLSATGLLPFVTQLPIVLVCFIGALITGVVIFFLGGLHLQRINPIRMVLAGVALNFLLTSVIRGLVIYADDNAYGVFYWLTGNVSNAQLSDIWVALPSVLIGTLIAMNISHPLNLLSLGEDRMRALGCSLNHVRILGGLSITLLIAASVSIAGPVAFVGLMIPHICRGIIGRDHRRLIPFSAIAGATLMVFADTGSRAINFPIDSPIGIVTALLGAPFFLYLATRNIKGT